MSQILKSATYKSNRGLSLEFKLVRAFDDDDNEYSIVIKRGDVITTNLRRSELLHVADALTQLFEGAVK